VGLQRKAGHSIVPVGDPGGKIRHHLPHMSRNVFAPAVAEFFGRLERVDLFC
jgi:hypothetical protein